VWLKRPGNGIGDVTLWPLSALPSPDAMRYSRYSIGAVLAPIVLLGVVYPLSAAGWLTMRDKTDSRSKRAVVAQTRAAIRRLFAPRR